MPRLLLLAVTAAFAALTVVAVRAHGYLGIFRLQLATPAGLQVLVDLAIALVLVLVWLWRDAQRAGRSPWPWIAITLAAGSFGPLLYLLTRRDARDA